MAQQRDNIKVKDPIAIFNGNNLIAVKYTVVYSVNNISDITLANGQKTFLTSPIFHVGQNDQLQARIICNFKGGCPVVSANTSGCKGNGCTYVQFLMQDQSKLSNQVLQVSLSYITNGKTTNIYQSLLVKIRKIQVPSMPSTTLWGECLSRFSLHPSPNWLSNDILIIECDITIQISENPTTHDLIFNELATTKNAEISQTYLLDDIKRLLNNTELADVTLKVGKKTQQVHKVILAARSPVFARMFQTDMAERKGNVVEISDMTFDALQGLLFYMYTDNLPSTSADLGEALLSAAEKYQLEGLKDKCEASLAKGLTVANAARIFLAADLHRAKHLKASAVDFIRKNKDQVFVTEQWRRAKEIKPLELAALFL